MAIKELITLEGVEAVKKSLADLNQTGEAALKQFRDLSQQPGMETLSATTEQFSQSLGRANEATKGFRDGLHILRPILSEVGAQVGGIGQFAIAARTGLGGLALAVTGAIIVALSKLADSAAVAQKRLETLLNIRPGTGSGAAAQLEEDAAKLGTTAEKVQPVIEKFVGAIRQANAATGAVFVSPPGISQPAILAQDFDKGRTAALALVEALRTGGDTQAKAAEEAGKFADALKRAGTVNGDVIRSLDPLGGGVKAVGEALNLAGLNAEQLADRLDKNPRKIDELVRGLARLEPALRSALKEEPITAFDDALGRVSESWSKLFHEFATSTFAVGFLNVIAKMPEDFKAAMDAIKRDYQDAKSFLSTPLRSSSLAADLGIDDIGKLGDKTKQSADIAASSWDAVSKSINTTAKTAIDAGEQMLATWRQLGSTTAQTFKFVTPPTPGTSPFGPSIAQTPAITPEQQATQAQNLINPFQEADDQIRLIWIDLLDFINSSITEVDLSSITQKLVQPFEDAFNQIQPIVQQLQQLIDSLLQSINQLQSASFSGFGGQPFGTPFAEGGYVRGGGTTTSDSILAFLSNMEFVQPARAVRYYGLGFMEAIRTLRFPRELFAGGGSPRGTNSSHFAAGGAVAGTPVTFVIDSKPFQMAASADTVKALSRFAVHRQISSTGRKPSWVK